MKDLQSVGWSDIDYELLYIMVLERWNDQDITVKRGTGAEVIDFLKSTFPTDEELSLEEFIEQAESLNGDGWDFVQIFQL